MVKLTVLFERNAVFAPAKAQYGAQRGKFATTFCAAKRSIKRDYEAMSVAGNKVWNKVRY